VSLIDGLRFIANPGQQLKEEWVRAMPADWTDASQAAGTPERIRRALLGQHCALSEATGKLPI